MRSSIMYSNTTGVLIPRKINIKTLVAGVAGVVVLVASMWTNAFAAAGVVVTPANLQGWTAVEGDGGSRAFVDDASAPGGSALQLITNDSASAYTEYHHDVGVALSNVGDLSYATKTLQGPSYASTSYAVGLDTSGDGATDVYYVYEPYWQVNYGGQALTPDTWQTWDVKSGMFWSTNDGTTEPSHSWADMVADNPEAVVSEVAVFQGSSNAEYVVNVDSVVVNGTLYNFQTSSAKPVATSAQQCKSGGWKNVTREDGSTFKNQGQCVAYVQSSMNSKHHRPVVEEM